MTPPAPRAFTAATISSRSVRTVRGLLPARYLTAGVRRAVAVSGLSTMLRWTGPDEVPAGGRADWRAVDPRPRDDDRERAGIGEYSRWIDLEGPMHYLDFGGPVDGPTVVCVHGLLGSAVTWSALAPFMTGQYRVLAPDLSGHGLTRSLGRSTRVRALRTQLHRFLHAIGPDPVILIGNSMGGMLALLEASADPDGVAGLVLLDPVLPLVPARPDRFVTPLLAAYATPVLGPQLMIRHRRASPESLVNYVLSLCCVDTTRVPADVVDQILAVARHTLNSPNVEREIAASARSIITTAGYLRGAGYRRGTHAITCPVLLLHGARDRLVPIAVTRAAARTHPTWTLTVMPDVGHVPQLEAPSETATAITTWLRTAGPTTAATLTPSASVIPRPA